MDIKLWKHQEEAVQKLKSGSILLGDTGSGKTYTALVFYKRYFKNHDLYIITTAKKRDDRDWDIEANSLGIYNIKVDSWQNIKKYIQVEHAFFIFDEQNIGGGKSWTKNFIKISKRNKWILLTATPGDTWMHWHAIFIANGFFKNKTEFINKHVQYDAWSKFPKIKRYLNTNKLEDLRRKIVVIMEDKRKTKKHKKFINTHINIESQNIIIKNRWDEFKETPIKNISEYMAALRRVAGLSGDRIKKTMRLCEENDRVIIFYNYDYELTLLKQMCELMERRFGEYNGHKHDDIPLGEKWAYLVNYMSGAKAWNCIETNVMIFYSLNYSYDITYQAEGRIDRMNTKYDDLYYFYLYSEDSILDREIFKALNEKRDFNAKSWEKTYAGSGFPEIFPKPTKEDIRRKTYRLKKRPSNGARVS